jgi:hypothetical protein
MSDRTLVAAAKANIVFGPLTRQRSPELRCSSLNPDLRVQCKRLVVTPQGCFRRGTSLKTHSAQLPCESEPTAVGRRKFLA